MSHDANWAGNPYNRKQQLAQNSLPHLLFRECHLNCVDSEVHLAETPIEKQCIQNCQEKTYASFDLMMAVKMRLEALKKHDSVLDISKFTEMEVEHGHDTNSVLNARYGVHSETKHLDIFNNAKYDHDGLKKKAMTF